MIIDFNAIRALLRQRFDTAIDIVEAQRLLPWFVVRCHLDSPSTDVPDSVIVKLLRQDPGGFRTDLRQVYTECAALEFVGQLSPGFVPRLWASDLPAGILIIEDLGHLEPLSALLQRRDPTAPSGMQRFARALGQLAARTAGHQDAFVECHRALGHYDADSVRRGVRPQVWERTRDFMSALGVASSIAIEGELSRVIDELTRPGPFLALTNGDGGPNNYLIGDSDDRLIDFEAAGFRHAVEDAVCLYVPGPHWLTAGDPVDGGLEAAYRTALADMVPQAMDDAAYFSALASSCMAFAIIRLHRFPKLDARRSEVVCNHAHPTYASAGRLQLISTLESTAQIEAVRSELPNLCSWIARASTTLRRRWPDADVDLQALARYTPRQSDQPMVEQPETLQIPPAS